MLKILFAFLCGSLLGCNQNIVRQFPVCDQQSQFLEIIDAKRDVGEKNDGKLVVMKGILHYYFEDIGVYPSRKSSSLDALWLNFSSSNLVADSLLEILNGKDVIVAGRLNIKDKGHGNAYFASIDSVFCINRISR